MRTRHAAALSTLIAIVLLAAPAVAHESTPHRLDVESFDRVWMLVRDTHPDPTLGGLDWDAVRAELRPRAEAARDREAAREAIQAMLDRLGHSHLALIPAEELADLAAPDETSTLQGSAGLDVRVVGGQALVTSVLPGSSAAGAGVRPGWVVTAIAGEELAPALARVHTRLDGSPWLDATLAQAVLGRLGGRIGSTLAIRFLDSRDRAVELGLRLGEARGNRVALGHIEGPRVWFESRRVALDVGYVAFNAFLDPLRVMPALEAALRSFAETRGMVLDLRGNSGGMPGMVTGVGGWLLAGEPRSLGTIRTRRDRLELVVQPRPSPYAGRVAVLVDGTSMCGAEVLAAGLRDLGRARLFGTRTAGVVMGGELEKLPNGDVLMYAFASFTTARGEALEGHGLDPDELTPPSREALLAGGDPALDAAVRWIRSEPTTAH